jgi:translation elongation factor EF-1alpha
VPISALLGLNLDTRDTQPKEMRAWYNEEMKESSKKGLCLVEVIDSFRALPRPVKKPIRVCIYDYFNKG